MSINQRQFAQLSEMGISMWSCRDREHHAKASSLNNVKLDASAAADKASPPKITKKINTIPLATLQTSKLFNNIINALDISIGEVTQENDHFNLGLFNWAFIDTDPADNEQLVTYHNNNLITPSIEYISTSAPLKKQLWLTLSQHIL